MGLGVVGNRNKGGVNMTSHTEERVPTVPVSVTSLIGEATSSRNDGWVRQQAGERLKTIKNYVGAAFGRNELDSARADPIPHDVLDLALVVRAEGNDSQKDFAKRRLELALEAIDRAIGGC